ncbi:nitroreductase family protein [bacterium]|nr:nitroreductase family protein [bacterium]
MLSDLILKNRSYRRFDEKFIIENKTLLSLIELARFSPSAANLQPLKYLLCNAEKKNGLVFETLSWAGYLNDWPGPGPGQRPSAYILMLGDKSISQNFSCDAGIASQSILLGAVELGLGGCILGSIDRELLRNSLSIPEQFEILYVIALGKPAEKVVLEDVNSNSDIKYWRDKNGVHHVPKRTVEELLYKNQ